MKISDEKQKTNNKNLKINRGHGDIFYLQLNFVYSR